MKMQEYAHTLAHTLSLSLSLSLSHTQAPHTPFTHIHMHRHAYTHMHKQCAHSPTYTHPMGTNSNKPNTMFLFVCFQAFVRIGLWLTQSEISVFMKALDTVMCVCCILCVLPASLSVCGAMIANVEAAQRFLSRHTHTHTDVHAFILIPSDVLMPTEDACHPDACHVTGRI